MRSRIDCGRTHAEHPKRDNYAGDGGDGKIHVLGSDVEWTDAPPELCAHGNLLIHYYGGLYGGDACNGCITIDEERLQNLKDEWVREMQDFELRYASLLIEVKALIADVPEDDLYSLGLDHVGESCPHN